MESPGSTWIEDKPPAARHAGSDPAQAKRPDCAERLGADDLFPEVDRQRERAAREKHHRRGVCLRDFQVRFRQLLVEGCSVVSAWSARHRTALQGARLPASGMLARRDHAAELHLQPVG
jgi:hypothetical protein